MDPQKDTLAQSINGPCAYDLYILPFGSRLNFKCKRKLTYCLAGAEFTKVFFRLTHTERVLKSASLAEVNVGRNTAEVLFPTSTEQSGILHPVSPFCINDRTSPLP